MQNFVGVAHKFLSALALVVCCFSPLLSLAIPSFPWVDPFADIYFGFSAASSQVNEFAERKVSLKATIYSLEIKDQTVEIFNKVDGQHKVASSSAVSFEITQSKVRFNDTKQLQ